MPEWYLDYRASTFCPSVKPWEWDDAPLGWKERVLVAGHAEIEAKAAAVPKPFE